MKASVDATTPVKIDWLTAPTKAGGPSILQRFFSFWSNHRDAELRLVTNKSLDTTDPVLAMRDPYGRIADGLRRANRPKAMQVTIETILDHLDTGEPTLIEFLDQLHLDTDASISSWERQVQDAATPHVRADKASIRAGIGWLKEQVERTRPVLDRDAVATAIEELGLRLAPPKAIVAVAALGPVPTDDTLISVDLCDAMGAPGEPLGPDRWSGILQRIEGIGDQCRAAGQSDLEVRATCRLPTWFAIGRSLRDTQGFDVSTIAHGNEWASGSPTTLALPDTITVDSLTSGPDASSIAVIISVVEDDPSEEMLEYLKSQHPDPHVVRIRRTDAKTPIDPAQGRALAQAIRNEVRRIARANKPEHINLFLACPAPVALLLGHLWDRLPATTSHEYLGPGAGYEPTFVFAAS